MSNPKKDKILKAAEKFQDEEIKEAEQSSAYKIQRELGKLLESYSIDEAVVVFRIPNEPNPILYYRGHFYEAAKLLAGAYHNCRDKIQKDLSG